MLNRKVLFLGEAALRAQIQGVLATSGWDIHGASDMRGANRLLAEHRFHVGVLVFHDLTEPRCADLGEFLRSHAELEWIGCFGEGVAARPCCRDMIVNHLFDHHTLPIHGGHLLMCLGHAHGRALLRESAQPLVLSDEDAIVGASLALLELRRQTQLIARTTAPALIRGESGSGKELIAQSIHRLSPRSRGPFVAVNCGAISPWLVHSELFGHERGAFTGATCERRGLLESADKGTLFLDEIGDLPREQQTNLLRFLEEGSINRVGGSRTMQLDVRVVAATHVDLQRAVNNGSFRQDLFYRLSVLPLWVPPLRERREDIPRIAAHVFRKYAADKAPGLKGISREAEVAMQAYSWPGNVRELINRVRRGMIMAQGRLLLPHDLELEAPSRALWERALDHARGQAERKAIAATLESNGRNISGAARQLGVSRMTLYRLLVKHGINASQ
jgi:DNA-binding NtrC family response regulator